MKSLEKTSTKVAERNKIKEEKKRQKLFNYYCSELVRIVKKGCWKSAKKGLFKYEFDFDKFVEKHKGFAATDLLFVLQIEFLSTNNISIIKERYGYVSFYWGEIV